MHQLENGYTKIANTILEELAQSNLHASEFRVVMWAMRNTYGYHRKITDFCSIRKLSRDIKMSYTSAQWAISRLLKSGILEAKSGGRFLFNKNKLLISGQPIDHREVVNPLTKGGQPIDQSGQPIDHSNIYKEERKPKESERKGTAHVFRKPSLAELSEHLKQVKSTINPERFLAYYDSKGWKVGNSPMKDWKAAVRTWDLKERAQQEEKLTPEQIEARANKRAGVGQ